jgi:Ca2+-binding EF-hand superfamily protein
VKYIEVLAKLKCDSSAINTSTAKSVANRILNMSNKNGDGAVTEKEFIQW